MCTVRLTKIKSDYSLEYNKYKDNINIIDTTRTHDEYNWYVCDGQVHVEDELRHPDLSNIAEWETEGTKKRKRIL